MNPSNVINHIVQWLNNYIETSGQKGFVVGVSGGIDSAVTSTLCARTGKDVIAVNMPIFQAQDQVSRSSKHIAWLGQNYPNAKGTTIELTAAFQQLLQYLPHSVQDSLTMANTRSRLRMVTLYTFASSYKMLVAGTGNKVEDFGVGFYTKYGDGGVDLSPIADLLKTQVYAVAKELDILAEIQHAEPTDGLWEDDRTDENQIGASYEELEWAMGYLECKSDAPLNDRQKEVLSIYNQFHSANRHKMDPIPVCQIPREFLD